MAYFEGLRLVFNSIILITAFRRLPEFQGFRGKQYPGQLPPRPPIIQPRRMKLPPTFAEEWKNIGSKRSEFLDMGLPIIPTKKRPGVKTILVKPADVNQRLGYLDRSVLSNPF